MCTSTYNFMTAAHPLRFRIQPLSPEAHLYEISCVIPDPDPAGQGFSLPAWIPGSYMISEFVKNVVQLWAETETGALAVRKLDKNSWRCAPCQGPLTLRYHVYAWDMSVRGAHLDSTHGYFNGTCVFVCVDGKADRRHCVDIQPPAGEAYRGWRLATTLARDGAHPYGFGGYQAANYEELIVLLVEMGTFTLTTFYACGYPHDIVITGRQRADLNRLCQDLAQICEHHIYFFGEPPPIERYLFLVTAVGNGYGGLEHRASCSLLCSRDDLPRVNQGEMTEKYRTFLGLCSHEYFHTWNVKRITPAVFIAPETYLVLLAQMATRVWRTGGRFKQSLAESSFDAWIKLYKQDDNAPNAIISYYTKGALVALALDLLIRRDTRNARSLDDVMRALWRRYGEGRVGVPEGGVEAMAMEISGLDLQSFFDQTIRGTAELPLAELLPQFGVAMELRPAESAADMGGRRAKTKLEILSRRPVLGVRRAEGGGEARLQYVNDDGAAQQAGLAAGDILVALEGLRVTRTNLEQLLSAHATGERVRIHAFRRAELMEFAVTLQAPPMDTRVFTLMDPVDGAVRAQRAAWLGAV